MLTTLQTLLQLSIQCPEKNSVCIYEIAVLHHMDKNLFFYQRHMTKTNVNELIHTLPVLYPEYPLMLDNGSGQTLFCTLSIIMAAWHLWLHLFFVCWPWQDDRLRWTKLTQKKWIIPVGHEHLLSLEIGS